MELLSALKVVIDSSTTMTTWALSLVGASIATIVSTSYLRPSDERVRLIYLLYLPGWIFLGVSIYFGDRISRRYIAAQFVSEDVLRTIVEKVNREYGCQQTMLMIGLLIFGVWLTIFLLWWIFGDWRIGKKKERSKSR